MGMVARLTAAAAFLAVLFFAWSAHAASGAPPPTATAAKVAAVKFMGFGDLPLDEFKGRLETKGPEGLGVGKLPPFDPEAARRDAALLERVFRRFGYYQAKVDYETFDETSPKNLRVVFVAKRGLATTVNSITIKYKTAEARAQWRAKLPKELKLAKGDRLNIKLYEESKSAMGRLMSQEAHPLAKITGRVFVRPEKHSASIVYLVDPGLRLLFGRATVEGNKRVARHIILREKTFARGEPFNTAALQETRKALFNTGFFRSVTVIPGFRRALGEQVPVTIRVTEQESQSLRLGLGYGTEDEFRVRIRYIYRNPLGLGDTLSVEGKVSAIYEGLEGRLKIPHLFNRKSEAVIVGGAYQPNYEAYESRHRHLTPTLHYKLDNDWNVFLGYNMEDAVVLKLKTEVADPEFQKQSFFISSLKGGISFDNRDDPLNPTKGTYILVRAELASEALGSELGFIRPEGEIRHIIPLSFLRDKWLLALKAKAGFIEPSLSESKVPIIRRFFPGGADSVRGYPYQKLGPLDNSGNPKGGEIMAEGSAELRFPLWSDLGGVLFLDAGNAWQSLSDEDASLRYAAGFGFRYRTPVGPVRVDIGFPLNLPKDSPLDDWQFFLSVGQAF